MIDPAGRQLAALASIDKRFGEAGLDYWLFGGWAVDFHLGAVTRQHDDVDIAVWRDDLARIAEVLEIEGWSHAPHADEDGGTGYERDGVRLELTFLVRHEDGVVFVPLSHGYGRWPVGALPGSVVELHGTPAHVVGLAALAEMKASPREDAVDAVKDRADHRLLRPGD